MSDTIFALASGIGKAGVSVIRISGTDAFSGCGRFCALPDVRVPAVRVLRSSDGDVLDQALVVTFARNASFTGEDVVEFQLHGSPAIVSRCLSELSAVEGFRAAEPGEFTRRAFENGRLDLTQVEGLADLIEAETEAQRRLAVDVFSGELSDRFLKLRADLLRAAALIEATIDFADEDVPEDVWPEVSELLRISKSVLEREISGISSAQKIQFGFVVAFVGAPNVGKSTLLNAISGQESAIVSDVAGTTRDSIEVRMDLNGLPVTFLDMAGLRETDDTVERMGVERARARGACADLRIFLSDQSEFSGLDLWQDGDLKVLTKADILGHDGLSAVSGVGVTELLESVSKVLKDRVALAGLASKERHRAMLKDCLVSVQYALEYGENGMCVTPELSASVVRDGMNSIDALVGRVGVEDVLGEIFSSFCIGK